MLESPDIKAVWVGEFNVRQSELLSRLAAISEPKHLKGSASMPPAP